MKFVLPLTVLTLAATASASVEPYTETFADGNANWGTGGDWEVFEPLDWQGSGGPDSGAHVTAPKNFVDFEPGGFPLTIFRGQDNFNSSDGAFEGDWISAGVTEFSFWVRHDADIALDYFARFTPIGSNSPSMNVIFSEAVQPNTWTKLSVEIDSNNDDLIPGGPPGTYEAVFGNLGKMQIGADVGQLAGDDQLYHFDLALVSISLPAPGAMALFGLVAALGGSRRRR